MSTPTPRKLAASLHLASPEKAVAASKKETRKPGQKSHFTMRAPVDFKANLDTIAAHLLKTEGLRLTNPAILARLVERETTAIRSSRKN